MKVEGYKGKIPADDATRIDNIKEVRDFLVGDWHSRPSNKTLRQMVLLTCNNKNIFLSLFGRQNKVYTGEYKEYCWALEFKKTIFHVYSGKRGTSFELVGNIANKEVVSIQFLKKILKLILSTPEGQANNKELKN
jgi:hypothetical protein